MRTLKLQMQLSADGFVAGLNGEMDWMTWNWDNELKQYVTELTESVDCIVLGRNLATGFIPHWAAVAEDANNPDFSAGKKFTDTPKVVFTKTLTDTGDWQNTSLAKGDLTEEITRLKEQAGEDMIAYGGADFVASLIRAGLIDELNLFINPTAIGNGMTIFRERSNLQLIHSHPFECGIVLLQYAPVRHSYYQPNL